MINETMPTSSVNLGDNPKRVRTLTDPYIIAQIIRYQGKPRDLITEKEIVAYREEIILKRTLLNNNWARFYRFNGTPYSSAHFVSIRRKPLCTPVTQRKAKKRRVEEKQAERAILDAKYASITESFLPRPVLKERRCVTCDKIKPIRHFRRNRRLQISCTRCATLEKERLSDAIMKKNLYQTFNITNPRPSLINAKRLQIQLRRALKQNAEKSVSYMKDQI